MAGPVDLVVEAHSSSIKGRYIISGEHFQLVADGTKGTGGPGIAAGASDLLVAALLTCAINIFRGATEPELETPRLVTIRAHLLRQEEDPSLGSLQVDVAIANVDQAEADRLQDRYTSACRIYLALKDALRISFTTHPA